MSFFILGLPRSRTAWLANFMSSNGYYCHHEGLNGCNNMDEYTAKLSSTVGDSSTGLISCNFREHFPTARTVIIDNSIAAAVNYCREALGIDCTDMILDMKAKLDATRGLHVPYDRINKELPAIWAYLTHGAPYDERRAEMLIGMNITAKEPYDVDIDAAINLRNSLDEQT